MPDILRLEAREVTDATRWRWALRSSEGTLLARHEVRLDPASWQFEAFTGLHQYMWHAAPDRFAADAERITTELGDWIAAEVLGAPVTSALVRKRSGGPVTVLATVPPPLLSAPLGLARADGRPLALQGITFVAISRTIPSGSPGSPLAGILPAAPPIPDGGRLRVLGLFSLPEGSRSLNLRRERESLVRLIDGIAVAGKAVDVRVLQYGVTRQRLSDVLAESEGWDVIHLAGHGAPGELLLETPAGQPDRVTGTELADILGVAGARLKLVTVTACWSAAMTAAAQRRLLGLPVPDSDGAPPGDSAPGGLAVELSERLGCAVLAMRYPVADEFAIALSANLYALLFAEGQALPRAVAQALERLAGDGFPALSMAAPALFGEPAARLTLAAPKGAIRPPRDAGDGKMPSFPPKPERFVGRTGVLARASAALAAESGVPGVLLHGMPGGGKTACALELAYGHEDDFESLAWYRAPDEDMDISSALTDFALALERDLPGLRMADALADDAKLAAFAPSLTRLMRERRLLLVLDNVDSLLAEDGQWRDARWRQVTDALCAHTARGKVILTSRRRPTNTAGLQLAAVDALPADEALLLARELPGLRRLIDAELPGVNGNQSRRLAVGVLSAAHGHPKLLELADGQAANPERLAQLVEAGDRAWRERGGPPEGLFTSRERPAPADDYLHVLAAWTRAVTDTLTPGERDLLWILCCLEEPDREWLVLTANWAGLRTRLGRDGQPPDLDETLAAVTARGLAGIRPGADKFRESYAVHPGVAAAARAHAGSQFRDAVDTEIAAFWRYGLEHGSGTDDTRPDAELMVRAGLAAAPYLVRQERWYDAAYMLEQAFNRNPTRASAAAVLAAVTHISRHEPRAAVLRASVLMVVDPAIAETDLRASIEDAAGRADYRGAAASAARLADLYRLTGRLAEALTLVDQHMRYIREGGLGPWTQAGGELQRLQVLNAMGHASQVFAEIERLHALTRTLPAVPGQDEITQPEEVREALASTAREAALRLERWDDVLAFGGFLTDSLTQRHSSAATIARARFPDYSALLALGRTGEALDLLLSCRQAFQDARDIQMLGATLGALASIEHQRGHGDAAVRLEGDALRYACLGGNVRDVVVGFDNLGSYLHMHAGQPAGALASHLTSALIRTLAGTGGAGESARNAATDLRALGPDAVPPATIPGLCRQLGDIPGTDPARLIARLSPDPETAERTLRALAAQVRELATTMALGTEVRKIATTMADGSMPDDEAGRKKRFRWRAGKPARISLKEDAVMAGIRPLDKRARRHLAAGRKAEAAREYEGDIEACRAAVLAALDAGAVISPEAARAVDYRVAYALLNLGAIEAVRVRVSAALEHTDEAVSICRELNRPPADWLFLGLLGRALWSFAAARVLGRVQVPEAAAAIEEAGLIAYPLAAVDPGKYQSLADQVAVTQRHVQALARRIEDGTPLGMPGTDPPDVVSWRELFWLGMLERKEVTGLLAELKNADQVEAFLRLMDEGGDAEGARKLGELLHARDDLAGAEAAYLRGDERGSAGAAFYLGLLASGRGHKAEAEVAYRRAVERGNRDAAYNLGLILRDKGDTDGARAAFRQASESDDAELASEARDMLALLEGGSQDNVGQ